MIRLSKHPLKHKRELETFVVTASDNPMFQAGDKFTIAGQYQKVSLMKVLFDFISLTLTVCAWGLAFLLGCAALCGALIGAWLGAKASDLAKILDPKPR